MKDLTVLQAKRFGAIVCDSTTRLIEAARTMVAEDISGLVVQDAAGNLAGIITRADLLRAFTTRPDWGDQAVEAFMSRNVVSVHPGDKITHVAHLLVEKGIHRVVIVQNDGRPVGVISDSDLVYHMVRDS